MNPKIASIILVALIASITFATASIATTYIFPSTGTVTETKATIYLNGIPIANGTTINWRNIERNATWTYNFTVQNTGTTAFNVTLEITGVPIGITYTWAANNTIIVAGDCAKADLELTVSSSAALGTYSMGTYHVILKEA